MVYTPAAENIDDGEDKMADDVAEEDLEEDEIDSEDVEEDDNSVVAKDEDTEALEELEAEELALLDEEADSVLLVDEARELRDIRREEFSLHKGAEEKRSDEFVCSSCFMVKRTSQLAKKRKLICKDCAA
jgi:hypothetical protein